MAKPRAQRRAAKEQLLAELVLKSPANLQPMIGSVGEGVRLERLVVGPAQGETLSQALLEKVRR